MIYKIFEQDGITVKNTISASLEFMLEQYPEGNYAEEIPSQAPPETAPQTPVWLVLSKLGFRSRFTKEEQTNIEMAALDDPTASLQTRRNAARLRTDLADQRDARYIDVRAETTAGQKTREGVQLLEAVGILGTGRALTICNPVITEEEAWKEAL